MKGLSEGIIKLTHGHNSHGICVHKSHENCLITLYSYAIQNNQDANCEDTLRISIGNQDFLIVLDANNHKIIENLPVRENEEVWVTCSRPNTRILFGNTTRIK